MALMEIDGDELAKLRDELAAARPHKALLDKLGANPETRLETLKLLKKVNPNAVIPEIDAAQPYLNELAKSKEEIAALRKTIEEDKTEREKEKREVRVTNQIEEGRSMLRGQGWDEDGISKIEDLMQKRGIVDYDIAASHYEKTMPKEDMITPSNYGRALPMIDEGANDHLKEALSRPKGPGQEAALRRFTNGEINKFFAEGRQRARA